ncbi:UDP-glycosyltransferase [Ascidiimonas sp. W6]|uniref:glycosyltransferase n=1 Tax=Ascidiimonas meishanensis TaxID=3128903 RepID=UPI0030EF3F59
MERLDILVANNSLDSLGGSETFTYSLIQSLVVKGYSIEYFTFNQGDVSNSIETDLNVRFMTKSKYDLILANHKTCVNFLYRKGFVIQTCHGIFPSLEQPSLLADAYVSISNEVHDHLLAKGLRSKIIWNGISLERFTPKNPINQKLQNVLSLCHSIEANKVVKEACELVGANFEVLNKYDKADWSVEEYINRNDLVVGLGRSAYEAMACGRPVVAFDSRKYMDSYGDGYLRDILGFSILNNCSGRYSAKTYTAETLAKEFLKYDSKDGVFFRDFAERHLNMSYKAEEYIAYFEIIKKNKKRINRKILIDFFKNNQFLRNPFLILLSLFIKIKGKLKS